MLPKKEFFRILDEVLPGGTFDEAINDFSKRKIYFEKISMDGLEQMYEYSKDPRMYKYLERTQPPQSISDTEEYLRSFMDQVGTKVVDRTRMMWFIKRIEDSIIIGTTSLLNIQYNSQRTEWGIGLGPTYWGKGFSFETFRLLKIYIFEVLHLNRIEGQTRIDNEAVISLLITMGAVKEGVARQFYRNVHGHYYDCWVYSLLAEDYFKSDYVKVKKIADKEINYKTIATIIADVLSVKKVNINDSIETLSSWDSLSHISIIIEIEKKTGVKFSQKDIAGATSIKEIHKIIN
tara:strand:+ start:3894 stop:4766 length:873 start_codon:yes stop_codon:yes gene_type:complete